jgi:hypothetical protein
MLQHSYPNKVEFRDKNGIRVTYFNSPHKAPSNYPLKYVRYRVYHCQIGDHSTGVNAGYIDRVHCGNSNDRYTHGNRGGGDWNIVGPKEAEKRTLAEIIFIADYFYETSRVSKRQHVINERQETF